MKRAVSIGTQVRDAYRDVLRQEYATPASCGHPGYRMLSEAGTPHRGLPHADATL